MEKEATEKSTLRNKSIGTKVSEEEYAALEKLAEARGLTLGEWFRELVLAELIAHPAEQVILAEVLALRNPGTDGTFSDILSALWRVWLGGWWRAFLIM